MNDNKNSVFLVLLETSGNQPYIFSTNKLKENIGASEFTYRAGTKWVLDVVGSLNQSSRIKVWKNSDRVRKNLLNSQLNPPIETSDKPVEIIIATSGKALLLTKDEKTAKEIIKKVTLQALLEAPGLDICGVFVKFEWNQKGSIVNLVEAIEKIHHSEFPKVHSQIPSPAMRFLQLPIIESCKNSGLPASQLVNDPDNPGSKKVSISEISYQKQQQIDKAAKRLNLILKNDKKQRKFIKNVNNLQKKFEELEWLAVVHADGNGLGQIFLKFQEYLNLDDSNDAIREYFNKLREFSIALDICTEKAFLAAIDDANKRASHFCTLTLLKGSETLALFLVWVIIFQRWNASPIKANDEGELPLVPLILGGDDLTVICAGKLALNFTKSFLLNFEYQTSQPQLLGTQTLTVVRDIAEKAFGGVNHLSACAGVAIIKPHFPFSVAYELAENLIQKAKNVKKLVTHQLENKKQPYPCSAIDFHVLYDSSDVKLELIREKLEIDEKFVLHNRPYVVTHLKDLEHLKNIPNYQGYKWAEFHHWDELKKKVEVLVAKDDEGKRKLPNSQAHDLRSALFLGKGVADSRYLLIRDRYRESGIVILAGGENSLFQSDTENETTGLLDAIDVAEFI